MPRGIRAAVAQMDPTAADQKRKIIRRLEDLQRGLRRSGMDTPPPTTSRRYISFSRTLTLTDLAAGFRWSSGSWPSRTGSCSVSS